MKRIFLFLLKKYTKTEKERLEVFNILHDKVGDTYTEQSTYGNVYNANIEFIMSNDFIKKLVLENDTHGLLMVEGGLNKSFHDAINYISINDIIREKE